MEQFAEFISAVSKQMPKVLKSADPDSIQHLIENTDDLEELLKKSILAYARPANFYVVDVDYGLDLGEMLKMARLKPWYGMTPEDWQGTGRKKTTRLEIALVHIQREIIINADEVIPELAAMKFRPAVLHELLALAATHPDLQKEYKIAAFGTIGFKKNGSSVSDKVISYLTAEKSARSGEWIRYIHYHKIEGLFDTKFSSNDVLFAAVRDRKIKPMNCKSPRDTRC